MILANGNKYGTAFTNGKTVNLYKGGEKIFTSQKTTGSTGIYVTVFDSASDYGNMLLYEVLPTGKLQYCSQTYASRPYGCIRSDKFKVPVGSQNIQYLSESPVVYTGGKLISICSSNSINVSVQVFHIDPSAKTIMNVKTSSLSTGVSVTAAAKFITDNILLIFFSGSTGVQVVSYNVSTDKISVGKSLTSRTTADRRVEFLGDYAVVTGQAIYNTWGYATTPTNVTSHTAQENYGYPYTSYDEQWVINGAYIYSVSDLHNNVGPLVQYAGFFTKKNNNILNYIRKPYSSSVTSMLYYDRQWNNSVDDVRHINSDMIMKLSTSIRRVNGSGPYQVVPFNSELYLPTRLNEEGNVWTGGGCIYKNIDDIVYITTVDSYTGNNEWTRIVSDNLVMMNSTSGWKFYVWDEEQMKFILDESLPDNWPGIDGTTASSIAPTVAVINTNED